MPHYETEFPQVQTDLGLVRGFSLPGERSNLWAFYGIPYGEPPVGALRWRDARPRTPWSGSWDCTVHLTKQKSAYQWGTMLLPYFRTLQVSEDCLYLNVTTPSLHPETALPVIVWLHGGGLFGGSGSEEVYNLPTLPETGCVLVTVSTRLGAFGMLSADLLGSIPGAPDAGNFILSDLVESLRWVQRNIAQFGGDPNNVTIAGESGGAQKANALITVPAAAGLFSRVILQSGTSSALPFDAARQDGNRLFEMLGIHSAEEARALPPEQIVEAYNSLSLMSEFVIDGYYLTDAPQSAIASGHYNPCDLLMGANSGEIQNMLQIIGGLDNYIPILDRLTADGHQVYAYVMDQVPASWRPLGFQCVHSLDIAYLFGEVHDTHRYFSGGPWEQQFMFHKAGERLDPSAYQAPVLDQADLDLSGLMQALWVSFSKCGRPEANNVRWFPWTQEAHDYLLLRTVDNTHPHMQARLQDLV